MLIAFCANTSWYLYNFRKNLMRAFQHKGHRIAVIAPFDHYTEKLTALGVECYDVTMWQTGTNPFQEWRTFAQFARRISALQPDMLLTFTVKCNLYGGIISRVCSFKQIATISGLGEVFDRTTPLTILVRYFYRVALRSAAKVFFQNREDMDAFIQQGILPETVCERLPGSGVDLAKFRPEFSRHRHQKRIFLMFGRLVPQKGYDLFLQAAEQIMRRGDANAEFWILGIEDRSRQESRALFDTILNAHDTGVITYFPATDDVVSILRRADVIVLPSHYHEGVPKCLLEALACGKPIITTDWKGCRDTVEDGVNGVLIPPDDVASLIRAINFFSTCEHETLVKMGNLSRKKAEQEFDEQLVISKYLQHG